MGMQFVGSVEKLSFICSIKFLLSKEIRSACFLRSLIYQKFYLNEIYGQFVTKNSALFTVSSKYFDNRVMCCCFERMRNMFAKLYVAVHRSDRTRVRVNECNTQLSVYAVLLPKFVLFFGLSLT